MRAQIKDLSELVGRTIEGAHELYLTDTSIVLILSGNAFVHIEPEHQPYQDGDMQFTVNDDFPWPEPQSVEWGLLTETEEAQRKEDERRRRESESVKWLEIREEADRATYERLRAKFEGKGQ